METEFLLLTVAGAELVDMADALAADGWGGRRACCQVSEVVCRWLAADTSPAGIGARAVRDAAGDDRRLFEGDATDGN